MNYEDILSKIDEQRQTQQVTNQLYRYTGLIHAIEFFSQRFSSEQILDYTYDFLNELLILDQIAIFSKRSNQYVLVKSKGFDCNSYVVPFDEKYNMIATFHGHILQHEDMLRFFPEELLNSFPSNIGVPLIIENELYGFILANRSPLNSNFNQDDYIIAEALMQLFNTSLSNYKSYQDLNDTKLELDEKIFNLFAINQSSKALLSELDLQVLYSLSIDVFSELTQSSITSFFLYDDVSETYLLRGMKDTLNPYQSRRLSLFTRPNPNINSSRTILNMGNSYDIQYFNSLFNKGYDTIQILNPQYIVLLIRNTELLGFVTLGENVTGKPYNSSIFELIESLSSSTYIALSNAKNFVKINEQKKLLQNKFERLISLNHLMKNINSAHTIEELAELTLNTLEISFGMKTGLLALFDTERNVFQVLHSINIEQCPSQFPLSDQLHCLLEGENYILNSVEQIPECLPNQLANSLNNISGTLLVPICIEAIETKLLGVIGVFDFSDNILSNPENVITVDTIANHISPVLYHLNEIKQQTKGLIPNYGHLFMEELKQSINEAEELFMELEILHIHNPNFSFVPIKVPSHYVNQYNKTFPISNSDVFVIDFDSKAIEDLKSTVPEACQLSIYRYKKDFTSLDDFIQLF